MNHPDSTAELCLPYKRATTHYEMAKGGTYDLPDYPHHPRPSAVIAL